MAPGLNTADSLCAQLLEHRLREVSLQGPQGDNEMGHLGVEGAACLEVGRGLEELVLEPERGGEPILQGREELPRTGQERHVPELGPMLDERLGAAARTQAQPRDGANQLLALQGGHRLSIAREPGERNDPARLSPSFSCKAWISGTFPRREL